MKAKGRIREGGGQFDICVEFVEVDKNESMKNEKERNALNLHSLSSANAECVCFRCRLKL